MPRTWLVLPATVMALSWGAAARQGPAATDTGSIGGRVVDGSTGTAIAGAIVTLVAAQDVSPAPFLLGLSAPASAMERQATDGQGRFQFTRLPAGRVYHAVASKPGYTDGAYGRDDRRPTPRRLAVTPGQTRSDAIVRLWKPPSISGTVLDDAGEPAIGVMVAAVRQSSRAGMPRFTVSRVARTDDRGAYRLAPLSAGTYAVMVPAIRIALPAALPDISSNPRLIPQGSHENAVGFTPDGRLILGGRTEPPSLSAGQHAFALEDGTLVVSGAGSPLPLPLRADGRRQAYPTTFHPIARQLTDAALVPLGPSEERRGIDVTLRPVAVSRITGTLEGPAAAVSNRRLSLLADPERSMPPDYEVAAALSDASGRFSFVDVPDGAYTIEVPSVSGSISIELIGSDLMPPSLRVPGSLPGGFLGVGARADGLWTRTAVVVAGTDMPEVVARLVPGLTISGRLVIDTQDDRTALAIRATSLEVIAEHAEPVGADSPVGGVRSRTPLTAGTLEFSISPLRPGDYMLRMYGDSGTIKSLTWGGRDYTGRPITVDRDASSVVLTVTSQAPRVEGAVHDAQGARAVQTAVVYFPTDPSYWRRYGRQPERIRSVAVRLGRYVVPDVPAGDYFLVAVEEGLGGYWTDPAFLEAASKVATRVSLEWGETRIQDLVVREIVR